jgi:hypothetical protein
MFLLHLHQNQVLVRIAIWFLLSSWELNPGPVHARQALYLGAIPLSLLTADLDPTPRCTELGSLTLEGLISKSSKCILLVHFPPSLFLILFQDIIICCLDPYGHLIGLAACTYWHYGLFFIQHSDIQKHESDLPHHLPTAENVPRASCCH